ncbi:alpha-1,2-fucosyltransferase [Saccharicrinis sp. FJH62]|uniref:alpha-1,2-fucosyltransferase n=1 Tax=Saccharicrinis sp. FJH62 TaxID=3344657 RepID=UPI0035D48AEB
MKKFRRKHLNSVLRILNPEKAIVESVKDQFNTIRSQFDNIIGIHVRRGDYKDFNDGKYYYSVEEYEGIINKVNLQFKDTKNIFFIASNEKIEFNDVTGKKCFNIENSNMAQDIIGLSLCDYILGPPSTYSAWASLYHHVPLYFIEEIISPIKKSNFFHIEEKWM